VVRPVQIGATLAFEAAVLATFVAIGSYHGLCLDGTHVSCPEASGASWELKSQLGLAISGLVAVGAMLFATWRGAYRWAAVLLLVSITLFAGWAVLLDIATHDDFTLVD
jgi:hypothetical protein